MIALIDGDIVGYSCAAYNETFGWERCVHDIDALMRRILETTGADSHQTFLTGTGNFRYEIYPDYKANRRGKPNPIYRKAAEEYLREAWGAKLVNGYEADDALGISATVGEVSTICSIDKDLMMIPGTHYNWRKNEFTEVSELEALQSFYRSTLVGDSVDNIFGVKGIGAVKAARWINDVENENDMYNICRALYKDDTRFHMNCKLLWILREEGGIWRPPVETQHSTEELPPLQE